MFLVLLMNVVKRMLPLVFLPLPLMISAQEDSSELTKGFIADDLFIYMHAGAGNNYRILGTINAGTEIELTGQVLNDYTQIVDTKARQTWVESKYVSTKPGLRNVIAELNTRMANSSESSHQLEIQLSNSAEQIASLINKNTELQNNLAALNNDLAATRLKLNDQDTNIKKEYFYNGAIVLGLGLVLGLILPRLGSRKKANQGSWT